MGNVFDKKTNKAQVVQNPQILKLTAGKKYRTTHIQKLKSRKELKPSDKSSGKIHWLNTVNQNDKKYTEANIVHYEENIKSTNNTFSENFFGCFHNAYYTHGDVVLSPDDIMLMICLGFSKYVNEYPEELRPMFVSHQGQKELTVNVDDFSNIDWNNFAKNITDQINYSIKGNIVDTLSCNFSTSGELEKLISNIAVMSSFKKYYSYTISDGCGIQNVHFMGELSDWMLIKSKIMELYKYDLKQSKWKSWLDGLIPIIDRFIATYEGVTNKDFWNRIIDEKMPEGYGMNQGYISGWLLKFYYGIHDTITDTSELTDLYFNVEVKIDDGMNNQTVDIFAGLSGIACINNTYRSQTSMIVIKH